MCVVSLIAIGEREMQGRVALNSVVTSQALQKLQIILTLYSTCVKFLNMTVRNMAEWNYFHGATEPSRSGPPYC